VSEKLEFWIAKQNSQSLTNDLSTHWYIDYSTMRPDHLQESTSKSTTNEANEHKNLHAKFDGGKNACATKSFL